MKLLLTILRIVLVIILFLILFLEDLFADTIEIEFLYNTIHSNHVNQCNPNCAVQDNGGLGFFIRYESADKHVNIGIGKYFLTNSYGDPAEVEFVQFDGVEYRKGSFRIGISVWKMWIYGYKDEDGNDIVQDVPPWPVFYIGINPFYYWDENIWIIYRDIEFVGVQITMTTLAYQVKVFEDKSNVFTIGFNYEN